MGTPGAQSLTQCCGHKTQRGVGGVGGGGGYISIFGGVYDRSKPTANATCPVPELETGGELGPRETGAGPQRPNGHRPAAPGTRTVRFGDGHVPPPSPVSTKHQRTDGMRSEHAVLVKRGRSVHPRMQHGPARRS